MAHPANRVLIIGAGHNGLVAAYYLAKAGFAPLVLERRKVIGGIAVTEELHPGFQCPSIAHSLGPLLPGLSSDLQLEKHGLATIAPAVRVFAPSPDGRSISLYESGEKTSRELSAMSSRDAAAYPEFLKSFAAIGKVLAPLMSMTPPSLSQPSRGELWDLGKLGLKFRGLSKKDAFRLLRWGPMAVADLAGEWFESELLRAIVAARGIFGAFAGPWSAGTSAGLLTQAAFDGHAVAPALFVKGGLGALTQAIAKAATTAGAQIRTGAEVAHIRVKGGAVTGVVLANGDELTASTIVANTDPRSTYLRLIDPIDLDPDFRLKISHYKTLGSAAKVNLALSGLPTFVGTKDGESLKGRIHIGPEIDYIERAFDMAKYGDFSSQPYMDITIPSLTDPSLAPKGAHVMSIHAQYAPYNLKTGTWNTRREEFGDAVVKALSAYAPDLSSMIVARQVITPLDLEQTYGLGGGHLLHGEPSLDQLFTFRPLLGWSQYRAPIQGLYLCGSGTHPGGGITGASGTNASREIVKDLRK
jgi:phytoene dehydrogenase-like protein